MALYVYQKYNAVFSGGYYYIAWGSPSTTQEVTGYQTSGYLNYSLNSSNGVITYSTPATIGTTFGGTVYSGGSSSITQTSLSGTNRTTTSGSVYYSSSYYSQGSLVGQVIAEDGTYPSNGRHSDGFWYVRRVVAAPPVLISPNGGEVFNANETITWQIPRTGLKYKIEISKNNGQTWSTLLVETATDATSYTRDYTNETESSLVKIRITGVDGAYLTASDESDGVFSILHNVAPTIPTALSPSSVIIDRLKTNRFSWKHNDQNPNDSQSQVSIRWRAQGTTSWNTKVITNNPAQEYFFAENTFPLGQIEWQVMTYDQSGLSSPYSNIAVFTAGEPAETPVIVQPGLSVNVSRPVIEWTGGSQLSYQIIIENTLNEVVWDTGEVTSPIKARTSSFVFVNGATYKIKLRVKDGGGLFSSFTEKTVTVSYTPPAKAIVEAFANNLTIDLFVTNPAPEGTQPSTTGNDIYKLIDDVWVLIAKNVNSTFSDMSATSGKEETYRIRALGENGTYSESDVVQVTMMLESPVLSSTSDSLRYMVLKHMTATSKTKSRNRTLSHFAGRARPIAQFGGMQPEVFAFEWVSMDRTEVENFYALIDRRETLLYRDAEGRKAYVSVDVTNETESHGGALFTISFNADVVDYKEGI